jgi:hypothetical protein
MSAQLTTAKLATHAEVASTVSQSDQRNNDNKMQRWLAYHGDCQPPTREAREIRDWGRLVENDEVAAAIESATCVEGESDRRRDT